MSYSIHIERLIALKDELKRADNDDEKLIGELVETILKAHNAKELDYLTHAIIRWINSRIGNQNDNDIDIIPGNKN